MGQCGQCIKRIESTKRFFKMKASAGSNGLPKTNQTPENDWYDSQRSLTNPRADFSQTCHLYTFSVAAIFFRPLYAHRVLLHSMMRILYMT